jgi:8-oxo-dGTP pyrophosphatase MutT (NUDIX family)
MDTIRVVAGVNLVDIGGTPHVLLGLKSSGNWEFPGGKVEKGETDKMALEREWIEELNTTVGTGAKISTMMSSIYEVAFYNVELKHIDQESIPESIEHIEVQYHPLERSMGTLTMNDANRAILEQIYNEYGDKNTFMEDPFVLA